MKKLLFISILSAFTLSAFAQKIPAFGVYTTSDGNYSIKISWMANAIIVTEPNKVSDFKSVGNNIYAYTNPVNGIAYRIEVVDEATLAFFKPQTPTNRTIVLYSKDKSEIGYANKEEYSKYIERANFYKDQMRIDSKDAQSWAFCAAAAYARATYSKEDFEKYAKSARDSVKLILINKEKCPCADVIPLEVWGKKKVSK
ncbi:hypothetical protein [Solitalea lacus]|uniref:hypothetical protein n=1 Tax=Solitalea lacus TaxID=2911172 RepID=UPI001EDA21E7|nr:hypothetical protein [Solitalea lacus]UKJ08764.1 hypothetical protein L2B55_06260 [Solitalea lacus]